MKYLDDAQFHVRLNVVMIVVWTILLGPILLWFRESILVLVLLSWWAIWAGHISAWLAAKAEREIEANSPTDSG